MFAGSTAALTLARSTISPARDVSTAEPIPMAVEVIQVERTDRFEKTVSFLGRVEAARESELSFERMGLITRVNVDEGDTVDAMQSLAELDVEQLKARRDEITARLQAASATLEEMIAGPRPEAIEAQRAEVSRLGAELKRVTLQRDRQSRLLPRMATSTEEYESALYAAQATQSALNAATALLEELENGTRAEQVMTQRAVVRQIEAERYSIDVEIRKSQLFAPFAGTVAERFVDEGRVVAPGQSILRLLEMSCPEIRVGVDSATAASLAVGERLPVTIHNETHLAVIKAIRSDLADTTRTVDILLSLVDEHDSPRLAVRSGDLATVQIAQITRREGVWIPIESLTEGSRGLWSVFALSPAALSPAALSPAALSPAALSPAALSPAALSPAALSPAALSPAASVVDRVQHRVERRDVEVLHTTADRVFVRGAIGAGDQIVASGVHRLVAGQSVRPAWRDRRLALRESQ
ncbi:efflux RND transporter periplasmic adaptor subunit [Stieleria neptunia]|uniref:efflux RND transporter periplasmic adaptor subunit n=1 Tax=Stieleria neptunia TaxID=2527979 RepID=UPI0018D23B6F|nr:HlyD family efflux transporter periplasmic adaptor subunit [Stieleria neptunia]